MDIMYIMRRDIGYVIPKSTPMLLKWAPFAHPERHGPERGTKKMRNHFS